MCSGNGRASMGQSSVPRGRSGHGSGRPGSSSHADRARGGEGGARLRRRWRGFYCWRRAGAGQEQGGQRVVARGGDCRSSGGKKGRKAVGRRTRRSASEALAGLVPHDGRGCGRGQGGFVCCTTAHRQRTLWPRCRCRCRSHTTHYGGGGGSGGGSGSSSSGSGRASAGVGDGTGSAASSKRGNGRARKAAEPGAGQSVGTAAVTPLGGHGLRLVHAGCCT